MAQGLWVPLPRTGTSVQPQGPQEGRQPRVWVSNTGLLAPWWPPDRERSVLSAGNRSLCQGVYSWAWHSRDGLIYLSVFNSRGAEIGAD